MSDRSFISVTPMINSMSASLPGGGIFWSIEIPPPPPFLGELWFYVYQCSSNVELHKSVLEKNV